MPLYESCTERSLPASRLLDAAEIAIRERSDNEPSVVPGGPNFDYRLALETRKLWARGRTLDIAFIGGTRAIRDRVIQYARRWESYANIRFRFIDSKARAVVRIAFRKGGSWSYRGTDALLIKNKHDPTMNFGWLTPELPSDRFGRVVKHEFGHALGAIHEHQSPSAGIPWNKQAVYDYYAKPPNKWSKKKVDQNIFKKYAHSQVNATAYDLHSIMHYPVPNNLTLGDFSVPLNTRISPTDERFMKKAYPRTHSA